MSLMDRSIFLLGIDQEVELLVHGEGVVIFSKYAKWFFKVVGGGRFLGFVTNTFTVRLNVRVTVRRAHCLEVRNMVGQHPMAQVTEGAVCHGHAGLGLVLCVLSSPAHFGEACSLVVSAAFLSIHSVF